jgi:phage terminase large subunit
MLGILLAQRLQVLSVASDSPELQGMLLLQCERDILFWFRQFCWTFDPRLSQPHRPFIPYPYQEQVVRELCTSIEKGQDLLIEKSRDMGISWLILLVLQYYWLFRPGANFHLGSRKQEFVDRKGDISTLM